MFHGVGSRKKTKHTRDEWEGISMQDNHMTHLVKYKHILVFYRKNIHRNKKGKMLLIQQLLVSCLAKY